MTGERLIIGTERLGEGVLAGLLDVAGKWRHSRDPEFRYLGDELDAAVRTVLTGRSLRRFEEVEQLRQAHGFPDWQTCVDALPPEVGDVE